ncbi:MAG: putative glycoside hydrolase [Leptospirales bacterium]|nr:putative glycoside hydrolase [Leptospirales bacterium]
MTRIFIFLSVVVFFATGAFTMNYIIAKNNNIESTSTLINENSETKDSNEYNKDYKYPEFYRGIYLTVNSANNMEKLKSFVEKAKASNINSFVLDVQSAKLEKCIIPIENVQYCKDNGIHPIARIVIFPDGLSKWPVTESYIKDKLDIAESACINGFTEIQLDYIRFNDSSANRHLTVKQRYEFIENFIMRVRERVKKYNVIIAADIFGRIPLNDNDIIGQKMESMDKVVDIICPMAYPSHYTWSKKLQTNPYLTVYQTSKKAKERTKNAEIVTWIQAFKMKLYDIPFEKYIADQLKATHDAEVKGYLLWNARQEYTIPLQVVKNFYEKNNSLAKNP